MTLYANSTYHRILSAIVEKFEYWDSFNGKTVFIAGSTGMIGSCLVDTIMTANCEIKLNCNIIAAGRSVEKAKERFKDWWDMPAFSFRALNVNEPIVSGNDTVDFVIHAASNADPVKFSTVPVDTLLSNVLGTKNLIEYGIDHGMKRMLFVSSGEIYGQPDDNPDGFVEEYCGPIDHATARACYPAGKRAAEVLCQSYISQYGIDVVIVRPCHVFGNTMTNSDSRAVSEFFRSAVKGENIVLKSAGLVERSHCSVFDVANAILFVLANGKCGEAYNIANCVYQMKIRDFAQEVAKIANVDVIFENPSDIEASGYSKVSRAVLSEAKIRNLGWSPIYDDMHAIRDTYEALKESTNLKGKTC